MADFPLVLVPFGGLAHLSPYCKESILGNAQDLNSPLASTAWPAANRAIFIPFRISQALVPVNAFHLNGATASGSIDVGIYSADGTRLCSTGSTVQAGTNAVQTIALTSPTLQPGLYYLAMAASATTVTSVACTTNVNVLRILGMAQMATAFALPTTATYVALASSFLPSVGVTVRSLV
jgi:hypothetical protein